MIKNTLFIILLFISASAFSELPRTNQQMSGDDPDVVGVWPLNEDIGDNIVYDLSKERNHGEITGAIRVDGLWGNCLDFDGNDYVDCGGNTFFDNPSEVTIMAWIFRDIDYPNNTKYYNILSKGSIYNRGYGINIYDDNAGNIRPQIWIRDSGGFQVVTEYQPQTWGVGEWKHIAGVYSSGRLRLYLDGEPVADVSATRTPGTNAHNFYIGRPAGAYAGADLYWIGKIEQPAIIFKALSSAEIKHIVQSQSLARQ